MSPSSTRSFENSSPTPTVYEGQFGSFTITQGDRQGVIAYRASLGIVALCFVVGVAVALSAPQDAVAQASLTYLFWGMTIALGISLYMIHIYLAALHRTLQVFWGIGTASAVVVSLIYSDPLAIAMYNHPVTLFGVGFLFAALTGIFFKEAFCFDRAETKLLTPLVPILLLGHLANLLPIAAEQTLLLGWAVLMVIFVIRKAFQPIPPDIGDKSVFEYLQQQRQTS